MTRDRSILVLTDRSVPRDENGRTDVAQIADFVVSRGLATATILLIADGGHESRDEELIATAKDYGWAIAYLSTTRTFSNPHEDAFSQWLVRNESDPTEIVMYGLGIWARKREQA